MDGVTKGFEKKLEVIGVGFKVAVQGTKIVMALGFSHPVEVEIPKGITAVADKERNYNNRSRQTTGRPVRSRNPRVKETRTLQRQRH